MSLRRMEPWDESGNMLCILGFVVPNSFGPVSPHLQLVIYPQSNAGPNAASHPPDKLVHSLTNMQKDRRSSSGNSSRMSHITRTTTSGF